MSGNPFLEGDIVVLKKGWTAQRVMEVDGKYLVTSYGPNADPVNWTQRYYGDFWYAHDCRDQIKANHWENEEPVMAQRKLYTWKWQDVDVYGHHLATNSQGLWVMEGKDGVVHTLDKAEVNRVMPFTVDGYYTDTDKPYSYFAKAGEIAEGDIVLTETGGIFKVTKVNSESEKATKWLTGVVVVGRKLSGE